MLSAKWQVVMAADLSLDALCQCPPTGHAPDIRLEQGIARQLTSNLPFAEWTEVLGSERLTGALLDRLTTTSTYWR
jgi:hypothetical protein